MDTQLIETALRLAGTMLTGLVVANFVAAKRWNYAGNLAGASVIVRQVFHVHCAYIVAIIAALAILCLGWPHLLLEDAMGRILSAFFTLFWFSRVIVQWTYSIYVWSSHIFFSVLLLGFGGWLMGGSGAAMAMNTFMLLWWGVRLWLQFFGFDFREIGANRFNCIAKHLLTALFIGLVVLLTGLLCWNAGILTP